MHYLKSEDIDAKECHTTVLAVCLDLVVSQTIPTVLKMLCQTLLSVCIGNIAEVIQGAQLKRR